MECSICWDLLRESPRSSPPAAKRSKVSYSQKTGSTSDLCCTPCGHIYHRKCLQGWLNGNANCPACRHPITQRALYPVFLETDGKESEKRSASQNNLNLGGGDKSRAFRKGPIEVCNCTREQCQDLHQRHVLLTQDYEEMEEKYRKEKERADVIEARLQSLQQNNSNNNDDSNNDSDAEEDVDHVDDEFVNIFESDSGSSADDYNEDDF